MSTTVTAVLIASAMRMLYRYCSVSSPMYMGRAGSPDTPAAKRRVWVRPAKRPPAAPPMHAAMSG